MQSGTPSGRVTILSADSPLLLLCRLSVPRWQFPSWRSGSLQCRRTYGQTACCQSQPLGCGCYGKRGAKERNKLADDLTLQFLLVLQSFSKHMAHHRAHLPFSKPSELNSLFPSISVMLASCRDLPAVKFKVMPGESEMVKPFWVTCSSSYPLGTANPVRPTSYREHFTFSTY